MSLFTRLARGAASRAPRVRVAPALLAIGAAACTGEAGVSPLEQASRAMLPHLTMELADTVRARALTIPVTAVSGRGIKGLSYSLDDASFTVPGASDYSGGGRLNKTSDSTWLLYVSESLRVGAHRVTVIAYDSAGRSDTSTKSFVSRIDTAYFRLTALPTLGGADAVASDVNQAGVVAGSAQDNAGVYHAVLWTNGLVQALPDGGSSLASGLNDAGMVVGRAQDPRMSQTCLRGAIWRDGAAPTLLPAYPSAALPDTSATCSTQLFGYNAQNSASSTPVDVNDRGSVITGAFLVRGGVATSLASSYDWPTRWALNDHDQAAVSIIRSPSYSYNAEAVGVGVIVQSPHTMVTNYAGPGRRWVYVAAINDSGTVVGTEQWLLDRAFLSDAAGHTTDLGFITGDLAAVDLNNRGEVLLTGHLLRDGRLAAIAVADPGWTLLSVAKMNDAGRIIGSARDASGRTWAVQLTPIQ
jgi:uncharacterized membrane protein